MRGIVMATWMEAEPFARGLSLNQVEEKPFRVYRGDDVVLILSGIGKACAAMAAVRLMDRYGAGIILNMGAAGALRDGFTVGQVLHINSIVECDRPVLISGKPRIFLPKVLEGHAMAVLATQDIPVLEPERRAALAVQADLIDMEGAAVAQACGLYGKDACFFKIVTDTPEHRKDADIIRNVRATRDDLYTYYRENILF